MASVTYQVRLKPHDPERGHIRRAVTIASISKHFEAGVIVDGISEHEAKILRSIKQHETKLDSPPAFDVLSADEMKARVAGETKAKLGLTPEVMDALRSQLGAEGSVGTPGAVEAPLTDAPKSGTAPTTTAKPRRGAR